ncbi:MAG: glycoside hydrolase family 5 protein [Bacteroidales bacterium]|nr:glycoside hydrolase family 5 protein [Bacteroidales bacterium]
MRRLFFCVAAALCMAFSAMGADAGSRESRFMGVNGTELITPDGDTFFMRGTNLGNWLNPEGYMFGFKKTNSPRFINEMLCQLVGEEKTAEFWKDFKDNYITRADIEFIASTGATTIRLPFHYKLFTDEDYMGLCSAQDGFERVDSLISWCRDNGLYLILDMHDAPGGQTGDNIDDSFGYPWLFRSPDAQKKFCDIWERIAARYADEPVVLGYELLNEPIAPYFKDVEELNGMLEPLYKKAVAAIRRSDPNHIVILGGAQWNGNFEPFTDWTFDDRLIYSCHRYGGDATRDAIASLIAFRDKSGRPMYMGEIGHNTDKWQNDFCNVMEQAGIGYLFWPYKKLEGSCMMAINRPDGWDAIVTFSEADRSSYSAIRDARPDCAEAARALDGFIENCRAQNTVPQKDYIHSMKLSE